MFQLPKVVKQIVLITVWALAEAAFAVETSGAPQDCESLVTGQNESPLAQRFEPFPKLGDISSELIESKDILSHSTWRDLAKFDSEKMRAIVQAYAKPGARLRVRRLTIRDLQTSEFLTRPALSSRAFFFREDGKMFSSPESYVRETGARDQALLDLSDIYGRSQEAYRVSFRYIGEEAKYSENGIGQPDHVPGGDTLRQVIGLLESLKLVKDGRKIFYPGLQKLDWVRARLPKISAWETARENSIDKRRAIIEFEHTHPLIANDQGLFNGSTRAIHWTYTNGLSSADIEIAMAFSKLFRDVVIVKTAITPNGFKYSMAFLNDHNITDKIERYLDPDR